MNLRQLQLAQLFSIALLAWFGYQLLGRVHAFMVIAVVIFVGCNTVVLWMLRFDRDRIARLYSKPYVHQYVSWICGLAGEQPPVGLRSTSSVDDVLLNSDDDFRIAAWRAKHTVWGHDQVIDSVLWRIRDATTLRRRLRDKASQPPLASVLLVGGEGIGKKYLARVIAKLFYRDGSVFAIDCDKELRRGTGQATAATLAVLLETVRSQPFQLILLEHIDAATPEFIEALLPILTHGSFRHPESGRQISFEHSIIVMTTTKATSTVAALSTKNLTQRAWHERAVEAICGETAIEQSFLRAVGDIALCQQPSDGDKAKVTANLMAKECKAHGLALSHVDPLILASEVLRIDDNFGFAPLPQDIKKLLAKPILAASSNNKTRLALRVRTP